VLAALCRVVPGQLSIKKYRDSHFSLRNNGGIAVGSSSLGSRSGLERRPGAVDGEQRLSWHGILLNN